MDGLIAYALSKKYADEVGRSILDAGFKTQVEQDRSILQTTGQEKILYFIPKTTAKPSDGYDEYIYSNNAWEQVGVTDVDLSSIDYETLINIPKIYLPVYDITTGDYIGNEYVELKNTFKFLYGLELRIDSNNDKFVFFRGIRTNSLWDDKNFLVGSSTSTQYRYNFNVLNDMYNRAGMWESSADTCSNIPSFINDLFVDGIYNYTFFIIHLFAHMHIGGGAPIVRYIIGKDKNGVFRNFSQFIKLNNDGSGTINTSTSWCESAKNETIGNLLNLQTTDKTSIVSAINETFQSVSNGKILVASAITDKGITTASDATFLTMAQNIGLIDNFLVPIDSNSNANKLVFGIDGDGIYMSDIDGYKTDVKFGTDQNGLYVV